MRPHTAHTKWFIEDSRQTLTTLPLVDLLVSFCFGMEYHQRTLLILGGIEESFRLVVTYNPP